MTTKAVIRPIYSELQGYLAESLPNSTTQDYFYSHQLWKHYNSTIDELSKISEADYTRYKVSPDSGESFIYISDYRGKLGAIIARLHGIYFSDEPAPFSGMPSTSIQVNQQQSQSVQIEIAIEMTELVTRKLSEAKEGSKEKSFLEKIRGALSTIRTVPQLLTLLMSTAQEIGLSVDQLKDLLN